MKKKILWLGMFLSLLSAVSCGSEETADKSQVYNIYVMNKEETKIWANEYAAAGASREEVIEELLEQLTTAPERMEYKAPLSGNFKLLGYSLEEGQLILNFDEQYKAQPPTTEVPVVPETVHYL